MSIKVTRIYDQNIATKKRIVVNQGGTGSGKTWSLAQMFNVKLRQEKNITISILRKALPTLKATAMKDFFTIMKDLGYYDVNSHNKTDMIYRCGSNEVEFFGMDDPQKARSRKRHYLWLNEANEMTWEDYKQLSMRTSKQIFLDYNPSDEFHWIYEKLIPRDDCEFIKSTYLDNPFLELEKVKEIERYKKTDQNYWRIYGLGERGVSETTIYTHWEFCDKLPENDLIHGLDFGFNHPTSLTDVVLKDDDIYAKERIHQTHLTTGDLIDLMAEKKVSKSTPIYGDAEDPKAIEEIKRAGYNIKPCVKGKGSVKAGIDAIKKRKFYITKDSVNGLKEVKSYRWREKDEHVLDEPVKINDDFLDSVRYAVYTHTTQPQPGMFFG